MRSRSTKLNEQLFGLFPKHSTLIQTTMWRYFDASPGKQSEYQNFKLSGGQVNSIIGQPKRLMALLFAIVLASCATPPQYDDQADTQITNLQKEIDSQIVKFISDAHQGDTAALKDSSYLQNIKWYNQVDTDLTSLELRMESSSDPSTANFPQFFDNMRTELSNIQKDHQGKGNLGVAVWTVSRNQLNAQFAVLLTYEISLKNMKSTSSSSPSTTSTATKNANGKAAALPGG